MKRYTDGKFTGTRREWMRLMHPDAFERNFREGFIEEVNETLPIDAPPYF